MNDLKLILDGIKKGDKNGGPTELAKILTNSLIGCSGFNKKDLINLFQIFQGQYTKIVLSIGIQIL